MFSLLPALFFYHGAKKYFQGAVGIGGAGAFHHGALAFILSQDLILHGHKRN
jgi:hypothetical protein